MASGASKKHQSAKTGVLPDLPRDFEKRDGSQATRNNRSFQESTFRNDLF